MRQFIKDLASKLIPHLIGTLALGLLCFILLR